MPSPESSVTKGNLKSGRSATPSCRVVCPQLWPHSELNTAFVSKAISYETLQLDEFVAGYATILQTLQPASKEFQYRLEHLISLMYLCGQYEWKAVLDFHGAVLLDIERGRIRWGDSFSYLEARTLHGKLKALSRGPSQGVYGAAPKGQGSIFYCREFNLGKCASKRDHSGRIGKGSDEKWLRHICSACWLKSSSLQGHPENSSACPFSKPAMVASGNSA